MIVKINSDNKTKKRKNVLFIIAIDNYEKIDKLFNAVNDAKQIRNILENRYNFDRDQTVVLYNEDATRAQISNEFFKLLDNLSSEDNLVIYYAGHGYYSERLKTGYWVPFESESATNSIHQYVSNYDIINFIKGFECKHVFLIADACFSGSLLGQNRNFNSKVEEHKSRWAFASGGFNELVSDGIIGHNSPFANSLLKVLHENNKHELRVSEIISKVQELVGDNYTQSPLGAPIIGVGDQGGQMIFRLNEKHVDLNENPIDLFCFNNEIKIKLSEIITLIKADKATIAFIERRDLPELKFYYDMVKQENKSSNKNLISRVMTESLKKNIMSVFYTKSGNENRYLYYQDISYETKCEHNFIKWEYSFKSDEKSEKYKSILLLQIFSEGQVVGIIKLCFIQKNTFDMKALERIQKKLNGLGEDFKALELRNLPLLEIDLEVNAQSFQELMDSSNLLREYEMSYLFYKINYREGILVPSYGEKVSKSRKNQDLDFYYNFNEFSLATTVLKEHKEYYIKNCKNAIESGILSQKGVDEFNIKGSIYATPVKIGNYTSFILVAWSTNNSNFHTDRIFRLAHLIANSIDNLNNNNLKSFENKAKNFIDNTNTKLREIDNGSHWQKILIDKNKRIQLYSTLIKTLIHESSNLGRVRLWVYNKKEEEFKCIYSISQENATKKGNKLENQYLGMITKRDDIYCQYTVDRYLDNPHAMLQHKSMFDMINDPNYTTLDKDPDGKWIVGPIINKKSNELLGFISADNHFIINGMPKDSKLSEKQEAFQRYAVDLISDLLSPVLRHYLIEEHRE